MATHQSAIKRTRQNEQKRLHNKYYVKSVRSAVKKLRGEKNKEVANQLYSKIASMLDKLNKKNVIHKNKASNLKSKLANHVNSL